MLRALQNRAGFSQKFHSARIARPKKVAAQCKIFRFLA